MFDRQRGTLVGLAVGDALGAAVEFESRGSFPPVTDFRAGGPHGLEPGEWTDDTSMALALADSLSTSGWDLTDQARRYLAWCRNGEYSVNGRCFDIGTATSMSLARFARSGDPLTSGATDDRSSGNGSIMRLAPVPIFFADLFPDRLDEFLNYAAESSLPTHASPKCVSACRYFALVLGGLIHGLDRAEVLSPDWEPLQRLRRALPLDPAIDEIAAGCFRKKQPPEIVGSGYVVKSLEAALWAFHDARDFREAVLRAVNLGDDADTTGAVCGQLAGAYWGESAIPAEWRRTLARTDMIERALVGLKVGTPQPAVPPQAADLDSKVASRPAWNGGLLKRHQLVQTVSTQRSCRVEEFLGGGGMGEVYRVTLDDESLALKWFFPYSASREMRERLAYLIAGAGPKDGARLFWPIELATSAHDEGFGYLMPLQESRFKGLYDLMCGRVDPTFRVIATIGLELAECLARLHEAGFVCNTFSFGTFLFDPKTGETRMCVEPEYLLPVADDSKRRDNLGTPDFAAPEIVRGEHGPDVQADLYSLAVMLFYLFHIHHPLYGKRLSSIPIMDLPARERLCGKEPLFIFDPEDKSNEAIDDFEAGANALKYWPIYPRYFRDAFTRSFTVGLRDREHGRLRALEWQEFLVRLRDSIFYCAHCAAGNFYDREALRDSPGGGPTCCRCKKETPLPFRIRIGNSVVMLNYDSKLYPHHLDDSKPFDFTRPVAEMTQNPSKPQQWGLKNLTDGKWLLHKPDGSVAEVETGRSVAVASGVTIDFGRATGEIRY